MVTTAAQRERWGLADLAASGRVRVVDEAQALGLLCDGAAGLGAVEAPLSGAAAEVPPPAGGRSVASALESVRALAAPGARLEQVLEALEAAELPCPASETLRRSVRALGSDAAAVDEALDRAEMVLALPWRTREPERFDPAYVAQALDRTHGGLERVKTRLLQVLAACPQTRGPLTVEGVRRNRGAETRQAACAGRTPGTSPDAHARSPASPGLRERARRRWRWPSPRRSAAPTCACRWGKGNAECLIRGVENGVTGRIVQGLHEAGVGNPVFILEELDRVASDAADALLDVLDPGAPERVPGRVPPGPVRSVRGAVDRDGDRCRRDTGAGTHAARGDRAVGVRRTGEARHRAAVPAEAPVRPVPGHAAAGARAGGAGPRGGIRHRPGRTGRGGGPGGLVGAGAGGIVGGAAAARAPSSRGGRRRARAMSASRRRRSAG